jgi:hypothetical protein
MAVPPSSRESASASRTDASKSKPASHSMSAYSERSASELRRQACWRGSRSPSGRSSRRWSRPGCSWLRLCDDADVSVLEDDLHRGPRDSGRSRGSLGRRLLENAGLVGLVEALEEDVDVLTGASHALGVSRPARDLSTSSDWSARRRREPASVPPVSASQSASVYRTPRPQSRHSPRRPAPSRAREAFEWPGSG